MMRRLSKKILLLFVAFVFIMMTSAITVKVTPNKNVNQLSSNAYQLMDFDGNYDWEVSPDSKTANTDYIRYSVLRTTYITPIKNGTQTIANLLSYVNGKFIRFDTAQELYDFSRDVSFITQFTTYDMVDERYELNATVDQSLVTALLSLDYVLGQDIDYSVMASKSLDPIGYDFTYQGVTYTNHFTGTFNGQGFEIKSLYLSGYSRIVLTDTSGEVIDVPIAGYYAMFPYNDGDVRNLGLINPNLEILQVNEDLVKLANIVGENNGNLDQVYVIDNRTNVLFAGIRYRVGNTPKIFSAAGIVHTNNAQLTNSYFASKVVVNANYISKFYVEPIVYINNAPANTLNIVYDIDIYQLSVTVGSSTFTVDTPTNGLGEITSLMKSDSSSLSAGDWYFYPNDGYPILQGMDYSSGYFMIESATDLAFFPELIGFNTLYNGDRYYEADFRLANDIDMGVLAGGIYKTPSVTFFGSFIGTNDSAIDQSDHYYIYGLTQTKYLTVNSKIYAGLFSILGEDALVKDLNYIDSSVVLTSTNLYYSYDVFVGSIAGDMEEATIEDVYVDVDIDMGQDALGSAQIGGIVGRASGVIQRVSQNGTVELGTHSYLSSYIAINGLYYVGGIVGSANSNQLTLNEVVNRGDIVSFGTDSTINVVTSTPLNIYTGGVIGYAQLQGSDPHVFSKLANFGDITLNPSANPSSSLGNQYSGGVIGLLQGSAPELEEDDVILFANFFNQGNISYDWDTGNINIYAAGVLVADLDEVYELALLKNYGSLNYDIAGASYTDLKYASVIYDMGSSDFTLTRIYNHGDQVYNSALYERTYGMVTSENDNDILLRYSANYGDVIYSNNNGSSQITLSGDTFIYAITGEENIDYENVHNYGNIEVVNINTGSNDLFIAGFSTNLIASRVIKDSLNAGNIIFADISGIGNIYVGGLVNTNYSGDLEDFTLAAAQPFATEGILNSVNYGSITTSYSSTHYGVDGTNNTFVGGIATLNKKSIQNSANLGDIAIVNTNASASATFDTDTNQYLAGIVETYSGGIVAGGVSAMAIDGDSRIYDTANSGDVLTKSRQYTRSGGVLGVSLYEESIAGDITSGMGLVNTIEDSVLSNGLNFGNISAITQTIGSYSTSSSSQTVNLILGDPPASSSSTYSETTTVGTNDRPPVYSAAGGVIGYGLSVMRNMLNHGTVSATDVAGGIVGATYVLGGSGQPTTIVNITTAVNYGDIKSLSNSNYNSIDSQDFDGDEVASFYMADGNTFLYPTGFTSAMPRGKRGFGGIFGRLQRGLNGIMTSEGGSFDFIVNANPNIDLIGRLDQVYNFSSSLKFFRFNDSIYYSAKEDDTTQTVFAGFTYSEGGYVSNVEYLGYTRERVWFWYNYTFTYRITIQTDTFFFQRGIENESITMDPIVTTFDEEYTQFNNSTPPGSSYTIGQTTTSGFAYIGTNDIPWITEDPNDPLITDSDTQYIYDPDFEMRTNPDLTEYIFYTEPNLLADRFQASGANPRTNGMYVLSTSAGQTFGAVLPNNIDLGEIELIDEVEELSLNDDYDNIDNDFLLSLDTNIIDEYFGLKQTAFSDQANLVDDPINQDFALEETSSGLNMLEMVEIDNYLGSGVDLGIDYVNNVITLAMSMEAFAPTQTTVSFDIDDGLTSVNALMGIRKSESGLTTNQLQQALYLERYTDIAIAGNTKADLSMTLPNYNITSATLQTLGYFTVYSEAFVLDPSNGTYEFSGTDYYNDYRIDIYFMPNLNQSTNTTGIDSVAFNGGSNVNITTQNSIDIRSLGEVDRAGSLTLNYIDENDILVQGYDFKNYFDLYFNDGTLVLDDYYDITSTPVNSNGEYSISFSFSDEIRSGDYYLMYSYFPTSTQYRVDFTKTPSTENAIIDFTYDTENNTVPATITTDFDSFIDLAVDINIDANNTHITTNSNPISYLTGTYDISYMTLGSLEISPFAQVISAIKTGERYEDGYKVHELEYVIRSESGVNQTYTHEIYEREINIVEVKKNSNTTNLNNLFVLAEDLTTTFTVDLGLENPIVEIVGGNPVYFYGDPLTAFDVEVVDQTGTPITYQGINISFEENLIIEVTFDTVPGEYYFSIKYNRDASNFVNIQTPTDTYLLITKEEGKRAYLEDIRFSEFENETNYPDIFVTDGSGTINENYNPQAYFNGIDYDGADDAYEEYFIIDGQVSNVPLDDYEPIFDGFLPVGATIEKREWDSVNSVWLWTSDLSANFTVDPQTGLEPGPTDDKVRIRYRVVSEDLTNTVYYDISVTDVIFNVTFLFNIYYCVDGPTGTCVLAEDSLEFNQELVIINIQNILTDGQKLSVGDDPANYPTFTQVTGLENRTIQFFYTENPDYRYRFSRNKSYFYNIAAELPLDEYLNDLYDYSIEFSIGTIDYELNDASDYVAGLQGKYFYIQDSVNLRTRRFNIYIYPKETPETDKPFGLFDFFKTWG